MDPGDELASAERLRHVVVGADAEPDDEVALGVAGREHEDGHRSVGLDVLADLEAVEARQHQVQDHEIGLEVVAALHADRPVGRDLDREPFRPEPRGDGAGNGRFVLE